MIERCVGVILAGGGAKRFGGRPKGLELVGGRRIIDRVAGSLASADELMLVANDPEAVDWLPGIRCERDVRSGLGSMGGIHAALTHAAGAAVAIVAWDMPFVPAALVAALRALGTDGSAAVPESGSRRGVEPLCAYYSSRCLPVIEARLDAGDRQVISFYDDLPDLRRMPARTVATFGDPAILFMNVNTPDDLARAERYATTLEQS